ncbi:MAG TPA: MOSC domain-containing protein [Deltaproteobacteria bacterium]|nr:MOSC domain-containing protein [Deltaproteobacteria bacterium]HCP45480.1 MOSC domain-containing protein [Deltaproteobacteria bacterium]
MKLLSIQVGQPRSYGTRGADDPMERPFRTSFRKEAVGGSVFVHHTHVEGDKVSNTRVHGGPEMAVLAYATEHYERWRQELSLEDMGPGGFAENLSVQGMSEDSVCIGDIYDLGPCRLQVSLPRLPCPNISRFWKIKGLHLQVKATGRTGWYLRVLREGSIHAGLPFELVERPCPTWTISSTNRVWHGEGSEEEVASLAACAHLTLHWRDQLQARLQRAQARRS